MLNRKNHRNRHTAGSLVVFDANFGQFYYCDKEADGAERHVEIIPLYALSNLQGVKLIKAPE